MSAHRPAPSPPAYGRRQLADTVAKAGATVGDINAAVAAHRRSELIARARSWTAGDCSFEHGPTLALIRDLADALEGK